MMNLIQTKLVGLTMELDLKAREYNRLCNKLEQLKQSKINPDDEKLLELMHFFQKNHNEILEINRQIKELKETEEQIEKQELEQYNPDKLFKRNNNVSKSKKDENINISIVKVKKSVFTKLIETIKEIFNINNDKI